MIICTWLSQFVEKLEAPLLPLLPNIFAYDLIFRWRREAEGWITDSLPGEVLPAEGLRARGHSAFQSRKSALHWPSVCVRGSTAPPGRPLAPLRSLPPHTHTQHRPTRRMEGINWPENSLRAGACVPCPFCAQFWRHASHTMDAQRVCD